MIPLKNKYELEVGIKFSKNGIIEYIENFLETENPNNQNDPKIARSWKEKEVFAPGVKLHLKDGGSQFNS